MNLISQKKKQVLRSYMTCPRSPSQRTVKAVTWTWNPSTPPPVPLQYSYTDSAFWLVTQHLLLLCQFHIHPLTFPQYIYTKGLTVHRKSTNFSIILVQTLSFYKYVIFEIQQQSFKKSNSKTSLVNFSHS